MKKTSLSLHIAYLIFLLLIVINLFSGNEYSVIGNIASNYFGNPIGKTILAILLFTGVYSFINLIKKNKNHKESVLINEKASKLFWLASGTIIIFLIAFFSYYFYLKNIEDTKDRERQEKAYQQIDSFVKLPLKHP